MSTILPHLERLGLEQYYNALVQEGFDTWEILSDIQEHDLYVSARDCVRPCADRE